MVSFYSCVFVAVNILLMDHGAQEHCFTSLQAYAFRKIDAFYRITPQEIEAVLTKKAPEAVPEVIVAALAEPSAGIQEETGPVTKSWWWPW